MTPAGSRGVQISQAGRAWTGADKIAGVNQIASEPPPSTTDRLLGLLIMTGFMMVVSALPTGAALTWKDYQFHKDWFWAITLGAVVSIAVAVVGSLFLWIGWFLVRWRMQARQSPRDLAGG
jgi:hypothetical protein